MDVLDNASRRFRGRCLLTVMAGLDPARPLRKALRPSAGSIGGANDARSNGYGDKPGDDVVTWRCAYAAFFSNSGFHWPLLARPFMRGAVGERALGGGDVFALAAPRLLRRGLQRAAVGEGQLPRQAADLVHRVEMRGRVLVRLAAGEKGDARHRAGTQAFSSFTIFSATSSTPACFAALLAGDRHVRLQHHAFERDAAA